MTLVLTYLFVEDHKEYISSAKDQEFNILVVAGEKDCWRVYDSLLTETKNSSADTPNTIIVSNTAGETSIPANFFNLFKNKKINTVYICYDHDDAGKKGGIKVYNLAKQVLPHAKDIQILHFEDNKPKGYDLTDFLNELPSDQNPFSKIFQDLKSFKPTESETSTDAKHKPTKIEYFKDNNVFFSASDITGEPPEVEWIIEDFLASIYSIS